MWEPATTSLAAISMCRYDVLVCGPIFCDLIFSGIPSLPRLGEELYARDFKIDIGGSAIVAHGLHRLGAKVGLVADLGNDPLSNVMWGILETKGMDTSLIQRHSSPLPQVTAALSFPEDRAFVTCFHKPGIRRDLQAIIEKNRSKHLHICSFLSAFDHPDAVQVAHSFGASVSLDPGWDADALQDPRLSSMAVGLDIFLPSKIEICQMEGESDPHLAAKMLHSKMKGGSLVIKDGEHGAWGYHGSSLDAISVSAIPVESVDTTGAGDAFAAGFLFGFIQGKPFETCMLYGTVCGGLTTTQPGGTAGFPTREEMETWLSRLPL